MKWFLICLMAGLAHLALGNAKVTVPNAIMVSEQVEVNIQHDTAQVHGFYRFHMIRVKEPGAPEGKVVFPLILAKGAQPTMEDLEFTMKVNGQKARLYSIMAKPPFELPDSEDYSVVWISVSFPGQPIGPSLSVRVAYQQKLLDGVFYYLPVLDKAKPRPEGFEIRVKADRPVRSVGQGAGGIIQRRPEELIFIPSHLSMIALSTRP